MANKIIRDSDGRATEEGILYIKEKLGDVMYYAAALVECFDLKFSNALEDSEQKSDIFRESRK